MPDNLPTSYTTNIGISGVERYGGVSRVYSEFMRELQGPQGMKLYQEMVDNDAIIGAILFALQYLTRNVTFRIEPAQNTAGVEPQKAKEVAERVKGALFNDLDCSWPELLSDVCSTAAYGWAAFEMTFKKCLGPGTGESMVAPPLGSVRGQGPKTSKFAPSVYDDGFIGWKSWSLRKQNTLFMWEWSENSDVLALQQLAPPDYRVRRIPMSKMLLFRTQLANNNPEGRSILRNAVTSYLLKKNLSLVEAIGVERDLAGLPVITMIEPDQTKGIVPPDIWNANDPAMVTLLGQLQKIVKSVRVDEQAGLVMPWWAKFSLVTSGGSRSFDTSKIITRYDKYMTLSVLADFIMLGHETVGSKALASTKAEMFTMALNSMIDNYCATINRFAIPQLLRLNGIPRELTPRLAHSNPENVPLESLGLYIQSLSKAGMPLFPNGELEETLLRMAKLPTSKVSGPDEMPQSLLAQQAEMAQEAAEAAAERQQELARETPEAAPGTESTEEVENE